jgi:hypothetical protein
MKRVWIVGIVALLGIMMPLVYAQTITFEPDVSGFLPDGSLAADDMVISNQFLRSGVIFGIDNNLDGLADPDAYAYLEKVGDDGENGFGTAVDLGYGWKNEYDYADDGTGLQLGQYFLRTASVNPTNESHTLLVSYATPVKKASGEIWDLDAEVGNSNPLYNGNEQWKIEALNESRQVISITLSPEGIGSRLPESLDGLPWEFEVGDTTNDISALRISFVGTKETYVGIAFNNFSPAEGLGTTNMIGVAKINPSVEISWHSELGRTYQLQWSQGLGDQWHNLGGVHDGTGAELTLFDSSRRASNRMYRVLETY